MIYTVTFNPSLDYIVSVEDFKLGLTNRTSSELMLPGGKGINVSTVLGNLGIESTALGFLAGFTGKEIAGRLDQMGIKNGCIWLEEGYSRINVKLKSIDGTEINGQGPEIPEKKVEELMKQLSALGEGDVLFLAGSIPSSMADDAYQKIMEMLAGKGDRIVVDADESRTCIRLEIFLTTGSGFRAEPVLSAATQSPDAQMKLTFPRSRSGHQGEYSVTYLVRWHLG